MVRSHFVTGHGGAVILVTQNTRHPDEAWPCHSGVYCSRNMGPDLYVDALSTRNQCGGAVGVGLNCEAKRRLLQRRSYQRMCLRVLEGRKCHPMYYKVLSDKNELPKPLWRQHNQNGYMNELMWATPCAETSLQWIPWRARQADQYEQCLFVPQAQKRLSVLSMFALTSTSNIIAVGAFLATVAVLLVQQQQDAMITILLGLISLITLLGWVFVAWIVREMDEMDEMDLYDGGDRGGVVVFIPIGFTALWILLFITMLASRAVLREPPTFSETLVWDAKFFASATGLGLLLIMTRSWLPRVGTAGCV